jgi:hypothetical protein
MEKSSLWTWADSTAVPGGAAVHSVLLETAHVAYKLPIAPEVHEKEAQSYIAAGDT